MLKNTQLLFFKPRTPAIRLVPMNALFKHVGSARYTVYANRVLEFGPSDHVVAGDVPQSSFGALSDTPPAGLYTENHHTFELEFESCVLLKNNAMPHRDNNDYDKWMELHLHKLVRLSYSRTA